MAEKENHYGTGINSLGFRLTAIYATLASMCLLLVTKPFLSEHSAEDTGVHFTYALIGLVGTAALMALMSRKLTGPIRELTAVAKAIAKGNLDVKVPTNCSCEIGALSKSMDTMVRRLRDSTAEIRDLADNDPVTGLPNRHRFQTLLERQMAAQSTDGTNASGSVFFIKVIELRKVSDRFGHETADTLLQNVANLIVRASPCRTLYQNQQNLKNDATIFAPVIARFGGTELILSIPGLTDPSAIEAISNRLHEAMVDLIEVTGRQFQPKIAIGIARYPDDSVSAKKVKQYAALACNHAMSTPETRKTALFQSKMLEVIKTRESIERDLRTAIAENQFEVYYQPKVSAHDWAVTGVEALVRLNHPERGVVGPGEFIPVAEITGLIFDIGRIVLEDAVAQCAAWARAGRLIEVSINVSIEQLQKADFSEMLVSIIEKNDCPAHLITIEITETIANTDIGGVAGHIATLRSAGIRIAIDDFGTGYSNLAQLNDLKFDILKVDRSFVSGIENEGTSREISRAIIQLGKNLGCRVIVEGTETAGQVTAAAALGCDELQGFYFSKPMKRCDFELWTTLRSKNPLKDSLNRIAAGGLLKSPSLGTGMVAQQCHLQSLR
ncbi:EAL domain-containing protein [Hoeflea sp. AS60]|uniref:EAL domain-containing protein n=1 Tax=Hoeflea sp. AS60 TaxID=3135780 RepID=UPI00316FE768